MPKFVSVFTLCLALVGAHQSAFADNSDEAIISKAVDKLIEEYGEIVAGAPQDVEYLRDDAWVLDASQIERNFPEIRPSKNTKYVAFDVDTSVIDIVVISFNASSGELKRFYEIDYGERSHSSRRAITEDSKEKILEIAGKKTEEVYKLMMGLRNIGSVQTGCKVVDAEDGMLQCTTLNNTGEGDWSEGVLVKWHVRKRLSGWYDFSATDDVELLAH